MKRRRLAVLEEDSSGLQAMVSHLNEQIETLVEGYRLEHSKLKKLVRRRSEALSMFWENVAANLAVEVRMLSRVLALFLPSSSSVLPIS